MRKRKTEEDVELTEKVVQNIRALLAVKNIPIGEFERKIGSATGYFARIKTGNTTITLGKTYRAANELGVTVDELISGDFAKEILLERLNTLRKEMKEIEKRLDGGQLIIEREKTNERRERKGLL